MSKRIKLSLVLLFSVLALSAFAIAGINPIKNSAMADTPDVFEFENGAYVKIVDNGGMRFRLKMDETTKNSVTNENTITFYAIPETYFNAAVDAAEGKDYKNVNYASLVSSGKATTMNADPAKIYAGKTTGDVYDGYYYANLLLDINKNTDPEAYRNLSLVAVAVWDGNYAKSPAKSLDYIANKGVYDGYLDEVMTTYGWLGSSDDYKVNVTTTDEYDTLCDLLSVSETDYTNKYICLNDVADTESLSDSYKNAYNYKITSKSEFETFLTAMKNNSAAIYADKIYFLTADIDMTDYVGSTAWNTDFSVGFAGTFDGRGHTIYGGTYGQGGMFKGITAAGKVRNFNLVAPNIRASYSGVIACLLAGKMENVNVMINGKLSTNDTAYSEACLFYNTKTGSSVYGSSLYVYDLPTGYTTAKKSLSFAVINNFYYQGNDPDCNVLYSQVLESVFHAASSYTRKFYVQTLDGETVIEKIRKFLMRLSNFNLLFKTRRGFPYKSSKTRKFRRERTANSCLLIAINICAWVKICFPTRRA